MKKILGVWEQIEKLIKLEDVVKYRATWVQSHWDPESLEYIGEVIFDIHLWYKAMVKV